MAGLGSWLTGQKDGTDEPTKSIFGGVGDTLNQKIFDDPASRAALLQIGLNLMQPVGIGQTVGGHIAQSIGAGGEEVTREEERQRKQDQADAELAIKERQAAAREKEVGFYGEGVKNKNAQDRLEIERLKGEFSKGKMTEEGLTDMATKMWTAVNGIAADPENPDVKKYKGMSIPMLREAIRQDYKTADYGGGGGGGGTTTPPPPGGKPQTIRQGGYTYTLQPDGSYK